MLAVAWIQSRVAGLSFSSTTALYPSNLSLSLVSEVDLSCMKDIFCPQLFASGSREPLSPAPWQ